jgi:predicted O-methyltransferase YrrM
MHTTLPNAQLSQPVVDRSAQLAELRSKPWLKDLPFPKCATMLTDEELLLLRWLSKNVYTGSGLLLDCGCFLGGSTLALAAGLQESAATKKKMHSFDLFVAGKFEANAWAREGLVEGKSFRALYEQKIAAVRDMVEVHEGDIIQAILPPGDIELLFIDCAKAPWVNDFFVTKLFPRLVPGSIVVQQDYLFPALPWLHITMEYFSEYFELLASTEVNSVVYACTKAIPAKLTIGATWDRMPASVKHQLMQRAINRWESPKRQFVIGAYASYNLDTSEWSWNVSKR